MNKIKILIVEDETIVALDIKSAIEKLGYEVTDTVTNHDDTINSITRDEPDIVLMDIDLKNSKNGIETANDIQKIKNIPIIYLTAYSDDDTINKAVETNPLGYLIKPFKREELKTTIQLGLYKINHPNQINIDKNCQHIGLNYYFDLTNQSLFYKTIPIVLSMNEKALLSILVEAKGSIIPFAELIYYIWPHEPVSDSTLRTLIYRLRIKLEYKLIETIPSFGCKLTPIF